MLNTSRTGGPPLEVFASQRTIDAECGASSFCRGNDHQLHVLDDIAGHEHAWDAGRFVLSALDAAVASKLTSKGFRKLGLTAARRIEEERRALQATSAAKDDLSQLPSRALQALDALFDNGDAISLQVSSFRFREHCCTIGTQDDVAAPGCHSSCHFEAPAPLAIHCNGRIAHLPSIAVRTLEDARSEESFDAIERGQVIEHASCYQEFSAADTAALPDRDCEVSVWYCARQR